VDALYFELDFDHVLNLNLDSLM